MFSRKQLTMLGILVIFLNHISKINDSSRKYCHVASQHTFGERGGEGGGWKSNNHFHGRGIEIEKSTLNRSEERRVGKECTWKCRSRWSPYH